MRRTGSLSKVMLVLMTLTLVAGGYKSFVSTACAEADVEIESCCRAMEMPCCEALTEPESCADSEEDCSCDILPGPTFPIDNEAPVLTVMPGSRDLPTLSRVVQGFRVPFADIRSATRRSNSSAYTRTVSIYSMDCAFLL